MLDYTVTCNHIHLLVKDTGQNVIAERMQLTGIRKPVPIVPVVSPPGSSPGSLQNVSDKRSFKAPRSIFKMRGQRVGELSGFRDPKYFQTAHREWAEQAVENGFVMRDEVAPFKPFKPKASVKKNLHVAQLRGRMTVGLSFAMASRH